MGENTVPCTDTYTNTYTNALTITDVVTRYDPAIPADTIINTDARALASFDALTKTGNGGCTGTFANRHIRVRDRA